MRLTSQASNDGTKIAASWHNAGVRVIDITDMEGIGVGAEGNGAKEIGWYVSPGADSWNAQFDRTGRFVFVNDANYGFEVYRLKDEGLKESSRRFACTRCTGSAGRPDKDQRVAENVAVAVPADAVPAHGGSSPGPCHTHTDTALPGSISIGSSVSPQMPTVRSSLAR